MNLCFLNAVFISDIHLSEDRPEISRAFFEFLTWLPSSTEALFILGDFFEYWVGDDIQTPLSEAVKSALQETATDKGVEIFFVPGNRDFALGKKYCQLSNMTLLADECLLNIGDKAVSISHGDLLCTDDLSYQRFRRIIRNPVVLFTLRKLPRSWRIRLAHKLRANSKARFRKNPVYIDVNESAVTQLFKRSQCNFIVHGHTHLADIHQQKDNTKTRLVLGDWDRVGWYGYIDQHQEFLEQFSINQPRFERKF